MKQKVNQCYRNLLRSSCLVYPFKQGLILSEKEGVCYGLSLAMADSRLSIYKNKVIHYIALNAEIYNYQNSQNTRELDQKRIKRTRLTRKYFCPSLKKQGEELYAIAKQHRGEDLLVAFYSKRDEHACYLSCQSDNRIAYMDPNHGAFLFPSKAAFMAAYHLLYLKDEVPFKIYQVSRLEENRITESKTLKGKWRSFLTGEKYQRTGMAEIFCGFLHVFLGIGIGALGAFMLFGIHWSIILGSMIGIISSFILNDKAQVEKHYGFLNIGHYLQERIYIFKNYCKAHLGLTNENHILPTYKFLPKSHPLPSSPCGANISKEVPLPDGHGSDFLSYHRKPSRDRQGAELLWENEVRHIDSPMPDDSPDEPSFRALF